MKRWPLIVKIVVILLVLLILALILVLIVRGPDRLAEDLGIDPADEPLAVDEPPSFAFSITGVDRPFDVAVDLDAERIYVTETSGERLVRVFDLKGKEIDSLAPPNTTAGGRCPHYVVVDDDGIVYVSYQILDMSDPEDPDNIGIHKYGQDGNYLGAFIEGWTPSGMAFDADGNMYVCNRTENCIMVLDSDGTLLRRWGSGGSGEGEFNHPHGIALDRNGHVYVADSNSRRVQVFDTEGNPVTSIGVDVGNTITGFVMPRGLAVDSRHRLYCVDMHAHTVWVYLVDGGLTQLFYLGGESGKGEEEFYLPNGLYVDGESETVYFADMENDRIQVWEY